MTGPFAAHVDEPYCYVTTAGRRSGRPHEIEIWFATDGGVLYLISGGADRSDWVRNLLADPAAHVRIGDDHVDIQARLPLPHGGERSRAVDLLYDKYGTQVSGTRESWHRDAYIVALDPMPAPGR